MIKDMYRSAFSRVTASEDVHTRIRNITAQSTPHRVTGIAAKLVLAAILVSVLCITASAAGFAHHWLVSYFSDESSTRLSQNQVELIEEDVQDVQQSQTCDGNTLEVKSVLTDGYNTFIVIGITAPEDVLLDRTDIAGYNPAPPVIYTSNWDCIHAGSRSSSATWNMHDDGDGFANTHNMVFQVASKGEPLKIGDTVGIHLVNLIAEYTDDAFERELEEKYGHVPKLGEMTVEEQERLWPRVLLAEGVWDFTVTLTKVNSAMLELLEQPVDYLLEYPTPDGTETLSAKVTSIRLSPLGTLCTFVPLDNPPTVIGGEIVMKDGKKVPLSGETVGCSWEGGCSGMFAVPISLDEVDYIQLSDGTILPMQER